MRNLLSFLMIVFSFGIAKSQTVTILENITRQPVAGVAVSSTTPKHTALSDENGQFNLQPFLSADSIQLKLYGYKTLYISPKSILELDNVILIQADLQNLEQINIVQKLNEKPREIPGKLITIGLKDVAFQNPQTTADLLGSSGFVFVQKSQMGGGSPMIRGMATSRLLLVVDGVRMNTAIFRSGNVQNVISLDANAIQQTDILFGPGSLRYGSDAIGGVLKFQTLEAKFSEDSLGKTTVKGNALMRVSTANNERTGHVDFNIGKKKWAFLTSFTTADYGDLRSGNRGGVDYFYRNSFVQTIDNKDYMVPNNDSTLQIGSKYSQINFMQKIAFRPNKNWLFEAAFHLSETSKFNRYDRLYIMQTSGPYKNKLRWAEWYYGPQKWNLTQFTLKHSKSNFAYNKLNFILAMQNFEESRYDREFMVRELRMQKENVRAITANLDLDKTLGEKLSLQYGLEYVHNLVHSVADLTHVVTGKITPTITRYPNGSTWQSAGIYANLKYQMTDKIYFSGGGRYSYYHIAATFDQSIFPFPEPTATMSKGKLIGNFGIVYLPLRKWQIYANLSSGFRAPNIDDMGKVFESTPGYLVVPNPNLKPEQVINAEIGTEKTFGDFLKIEAAGYYTWLEDGMVRKDYTLNGMTQINFLGNHSKIQALQNVAKIRVYGFQVGAELFYAGFGLKSTLSYQNGREQSPDSLIYYPLRHAAPLFGSTHFTFTKNKLKFDFYAIYNAGMTYEQLSQTEQLNPSYARDENDLPYLDPWYTLNFKAAYFANQHVNISAGVENILNLLYRPYSSGINAPGRNFIVSLRAKF